MILYHYTCSCERHLGAILADGLLRPTESNIGSGRPDWPPYGEHVAPDVVWLTRSQRPGIGNGLTLPVAPGVPRLKCDKTAVRFTVDTPNDAHHWPAWCKAQGINPRWRRRLEKDQYPDLWYVVERGIPSSEWATVEQLATKQAP